MLSSIFPSEPPFSCRICTTFPSWSYRFSMRCWVVIYLAFLKTKEVISLSFYSFRWWGNYAFKLLIITLCFVQFVPFPSDPLLSSPIKARTIITRPKEGQTLAAERACRHYDLGCARNIILPRPRLQPQKSVVVNVTDFFSESSENKFTYGLALSCCRSYFSSHGEAIEFIWDENKK